MEPKFKSVKLSG